MNRIWSLANKPYPEYNEYGEITSTIVTVVSTNSGYSVYTESLNGDHINKSSEELIKMAKDQFFKREYSDYAMQDAVIKVDELEQAIKKSENLQKEFQDLISSTQEQAAKNAADLQEAENRRNTVFSQIVDNINGYEERLENLSTLVNGFMDEIYSTIYSEEGQGDENVEGSTAESHNESSGEVANESEDISDEDSSL